MWRSLLACTLTVAAAAASAQVFECTMPGGAKEYARFCRPGTLSQRQITKAGEGSVEPGAANPAGAAPKSIEVQDAEFRQRMLERQETETKAVQESAQAEEFERNCLEARAELQRLLDGRRLQRTDPATGERVQYGDEDRAEAAESQRKAIARWCK